VTVGCFRRSGAPETRPPAAAAVRRSPDSGNSTLPKRCGRRARRRKAAWSRAASACIPVTFKRASGFGRMVTRFARPWVEFAGPDTRMQIRMRDGRATAAPGAGRRTFAIPAPPRSRLRPQSVFQPAPTPRRLWPPCLGRCGCGLRPRRGRCGAVGGCASRRAALPVWLPQRRRICFLSER